MNKAEIKVKIEELQAEFDVMPTAEAVRMAAFIRKNFLYWRMALRFSDGYKWKEGEKNYYVMQRDGECFEEDWDNTYKNIDTIYMSKNNAERFAEFCNKNKKEMGL